MSERDDSESIAAGRHPAPEGAARLVQRRAPLIAADWTSSCVIDAGVSTGRVLSALVAALHGCNGNTQRGHVHLSSGEMMRDLVESTPGLEPAAVTCLREVIRRQVLVGLPVGEALEALQCVSTVLDDLFTHAVEKHARALESLAYADELTGLANRRAATSVLRSALANASRHRRPLVVVAVDVDHLKRVNDVEGHDAGDAVLQSIAASFRDGLRDGDTAFRMGGDEFLLVLPEIELDQVDQLMRRVEAQGAPAFSYGAASSYEAVSPTEIVRLADQRLLTGRRLAREGSPAPSVLLVPRRRGAIGDTFRVAAVFAGIMLLGAGVALGASPVSDFVRHVVSSREDPTHLSLPARPRATDLPRMVTVVTAPAADDPVADPSGTLLGGSPPATEGAGDAASPVARPSTARMERVSSTRSATITRGSSAPTTARTQSTRTLSVQDDSVTAEQRDIVIPVLRNDDAAGSTFDLTKLVIAQRPSGGKATVRSDGTISYRAKGVVGEDAFEYSICTTDGRCGKATVTISMPYRRQDLGAQQKRQPSSTTTAAASTAADGRRA